MASPAPAAARKRSAGSPPVARRTSATPASATCLCPPASCSQFTKLLLTTWFLAIYLFSQTKNGIPPLELERELGVNSNTDWLLKHKLMQALPKRDQVRRLKSTVQLGNDCLYGESPNVKRGLVSENNVPVVAAFRVAGDGKPVKMKLSVVEVFRKAGVWKWAKECLEPGTVVHWDGLGCFTAVEAVGGEHRLHVTGGGNAGHETLGLLWVNTILGNMRRSLDGTSSTFASHCLAGFQHRFNAWHALATMPRRMLKVGAALPLPQPIRTAAAPWSQPEPSPRRSSPLDALAALGAPVRRRILTATQRPQGQADQAGSAMPLLSVILLRERLRRDPAFAVGTGTLVDCLRLYLSQF